MCKIPRPSEPLRCFQRTAPQDPHRWGARDGAAEPDGAKATAAPHALSAQRQSFDGAGATHMQGADGAPSVTMRSSARVPGKLRCGANATCDVRTAVRAILRRMLRRLCPMIPLATLFQRLSAYRAVVEVSSQVLEAKISQVQAEGSGSDGAAEKPGGSSTKMGVNAQPSSPGAHDFEAYSILACADASTVLFDELGVIADTKELRNLVCCAHA